MNRRIKKKKDKQKECQYNRYGDKYNNEGYRDPTAYLAMKLMEKDEDKQK